MSLLQQFKASLIQSYQAKASQSELALSLCQPPFESLIS